MSERPLEKPALLRATDGRSWWAQRAAGAIALGLGVLAFLVVAVVQGDIASVPDWWLSTPGVVATAAAAAVSIARRERGAYWLWALGLGLALASVVLGWFLMIAVVVAATVVAILILHAVM